MAEFSFFFKMQNAWVDSEQIGTGIHKLTRRHTNCHGNMHTEHLIESDGVLTLMKRSNTAEHTVMIKTSTKCSWNVPLSEIG